MRRGGKGGRGVVGWGVGGKCDGVWNALVDPPHKNTQHTQSQDQRDRGEGGAVGGERSLGHTQEGSEGEGT